MKVILVVVLLVITTTACSSFSGRKLERESPPLADMEEPLSFKDDPQDEEVRQTLPKPAFSGIIPGESAGSMEDMFDPEPGLLVEEVIENSPAAFAGIEKGDLLLEATLPGSEAMPLHWPSEWRSIEEKAKPGTRVELSYDRAGRERSAELILADRFRQPDRLGTERFREEDKVGLVLRTATEVEARQAHLPPGGGAVVVGLSKRSPWRAAGVIFGDLIVKIAGREVLHPQVVLDMIRIGEPGQSYKLDLLRDGKALALDATLSRRESDFTDFSIPVLFSYESEGERSKSSVLYGLIGTEETAAEWQFTLLWFIHFGGGNTEDLEEVEN